MQQIRESAKKPPDEITNCHPSNDSGDTAAFHCLQLGFRQFNNLIISTEVRLGIV